ncbi:MAG: GNAT family N-acetyltransferase [Halobacteriovoraceae bacterium]|nr:GNAT family N-acetyltransferase [Halobacteriovoraceae bacterium]
MSWSIVEFDKSYNRNNFNCGEEVLDQYLKKQMSQDLKRKANVPMLAVDDINKVIGYYTLSSGHVEFQNFPVKLKSKIAPYPVPIARVGRLAVDSSMKGQGLGEELLMHAIDRAEQVSKLMGIRAVVVDAKNENAENFYKKYGFEYLQNRAGGRKTLFLVI